MIKVWHLPMYWNYKNINNRYVIFTATDPNSLYCLLTIKQEVTDLMLSTLRSWVDNYKGNVKVRIDKFSIASIYNLCRVTNNYTYSKTEILQMQLKRRCSSWLDLHWIVQGKHLQACPYFLRWIHMCWKCLKSELLKQSMSLHRHACKNLKLSFWMMLSAPKIFYFWAKQQFSLGLYIPKPHLADLISFKYTSHSHDS